MWAIADDIEKKAADAHLEQWLRVARTTTMVYELVDSEEGLYWRAFNLRENIAEDFATMARTCMQWIYTIVNFKALQEKISGQTLSAAKVSEFYQQNACLASDSEARSKDFIDKALTVWNSFMTTPEALELLNWAEATYGINGPFNTISSLHSLTSRAKGKKDKVWLLSYIIDFVRMGYVEKNELSARALAGTKSNPRGYADLIMWKKGFKDYLLKDFLREHKFPPSFQENALKHLGDHTAFRASVMAYPDHTKAVDSSWLASAGKSGNLFVQLVTDTVYSKELDGVLKTAHKNRKSPAEALTYLALKELADNIDAELVKETSKEAVVQGDNAGSAPAGASGSSTSVEAGMATAIASIPLPEEKEQYWRDYAERIVRTYVCLIPELPTEVQLAAAITDKLKSFGNLEGVPGREYCAVMFNTRGAAESITKPHVRVAPVRKERITKLLSSFLKSRGSEDGILLPGDMAIFFDGGKHGNKTKFSSMLKDSRGKKTWQSCKTHAIMYGEDSLKLRRSRVRGVGTLKHIEHVQVFTSGPLDLPERRRKHYPGSNKSDGLAFVHLTPWDRLWCLEFEHKKSLYGRQRVAVGGSTPGEEEDGEDGEDEAEDGPEEIPPNIGTSGSQTTRDAANMEPVCYQSLPQQLFEEIKHSLCLKLLVDLSPSDGENAKAWLDGHSPYIGITFNDTHTELLYANLVHHVLLQLGNEQSPHFQASFRAGLPQSDAQSEPKPKAKPRRRSRSRSPPKNDPRNKSQSRSRKGRKRSRSSSKSESGSSR